MKELLTWCKETNPASGLDSQASQAQIDQLVTVIESSGIDAGKVNIVEEEERHVEEKVLQLPFIHLQKVQRSTVRFEAAGVKNVDDDQAVLCKEE